MPNKRLWAELRQWYRQESRVLFTSSAVASCVILLRLGGILQSLEWATLDQLFRLRPLEPEDSRVVIVEINETDLQKVGRWPIPDQVMSTLLQKVNALQPRAIGLDIYRDIPVEPGYVEFIKACKTIPNLIGIERIKDAYNKGVRPSPALSEAKQIGFNNVVVDADLTVRRSLLYWHVDGKRHTSFALQLAMLYLKQEGITPERASVNPDYLQLGQAVLRPFKKNDGGYVRSDSYGYQVLVNFRHHVGFRTVSLTDVLENRVEPSQIRNRIVLIGSTASSLQDFFYTPYSANLVKAAQPISGVELHANFISAILSAALDRRPMLKVWTDPVEYLSILVFSWMGATLSWRFRSPIRSAVNILLTGVIFSGISYVALVIGWWLPLIPPLLGLLGSAVVITGYLAHQEEELKRSKEFLQKVINTIPDPIFVKDQEHRWMILNQAYCKFVCYPLADLITKSDYDVFPRREADVFRQQDELVFRTGQEHENEEEFTDAQGTTHLIATKRSLHRDSAGNLFLVGVIRDITARKQLEEELKRKAAELSRSNAELKLSEDQLRHLAYHDALTGLPNRKQFHEHLNQSVEWARTNHQQVALLFLDLDGFKQVNDTLGHDMGDLLLKAVAQRLTACLRGSDTVSRLGGDEFTVILPGIPREQVAARVAEKILETLSQAFVLEENTIYVTVSIGISMYPPNGESVDSLIKNADAAMYRAKELGRNRYEFS